MTEHEKTNVVNAINQFANTALNVVKPGNRGSGDSPWAIIDGLQAEYKTQKRAGDTAAMQQAARAVNLTIAWRQALCRSGMVPVDLEKLHRWTRRKP